MIITITNIIQESLVKYDLNYELSGNSESNEFLIQAADAMLIVRAAESGVYISGMYKHRIPGNQGSRLRELCKKISNSESYTYSITSGRVMGIKRLSFEDVVNNPDVVHRELVEICYKLADFYVTNIEVPTPGLQTGGLSSKNMAPAVLKQRLKAVSSSVTDALRELEKLKDELESYKDFLEAEAQDARERADSDSNWNEGVEDKAYELEDKFSDIEGLYDEIDSAYNELFQAEMTLSSAVIGTYVLD